MGSGLPLIVVVDDVEIVVGGAEDGLVVDSVRTTDLVDEVDPEDPEVMELDILVVDRVVEEDSSPPIAPSTEEIEFPLQAKAAGISTPTAPQKSFSSAPAFC